VLLVLLVCSRGLANFLALLLEALQVELTLCRGVADVVQLLVAFANNAVDALAEAAAPSLLDGAVRVGFALLAATLF